MLKLLGIFFSSIFEISSHNLFVVVNFLMKGNVNVVFFFDIP